MQRTKLDAKIRDLKASKGNQLRALGIVPAVVYGSHIETISVTINKKEVDKFVRSHHVGSSLDIDIDGEKMFSLLKEIQLDPVTRQVIHMDFQALKAGEKVRVTIPIFFVGKDNLVESIVQELATEIEMNVLPKDLIDSIEIDVSNAEVGDQYLISDLDINNDERYEILSSPEQMIYTVVEPTLYVEEDEEAEEGEGAIEDEEAEEVSEEAEE